MTLVYILIVMKLKPLGLYWSSMILYKITKERKNPPLYLVIDGLLAGEYSSPGSIIYVWEDQIATISLKQIKEGKFQTKKHSIQIDTE